MKILILTEYLPASEQGEITGGVEAYCHYVGALLGRDHEVEVVARRSDGSVWEHATLTSLPRRIGFLARATWHGLRSDADVVVGTTYVVDPIAWLVARLRRRPVVFWYPDVLLGTWRSGQFGWAAGWVGELAERLLLRLPVDRFIAISQSTAGKLRDAGIPDERIAVVPCGFDPDVVASVHPEPSPGRRLCVVGRLVRYKRVDVVVRALARLAADRPDLSLVVVGQGPETDHLRALATELGVAERVELRGFVERHVDVLAALAGSTAFVSASEIEGFGIAVVEAMALGTPCVVSDIPAFREVTGQGAGADLFPPGDDAALAEVLAPLLDDADRRDKAAEAGVRQAAQYHWSEVATATAAELATTLPPPRPSGGPAMDNAPAREIRRLVDSARFHLDERGVKGVATEAADVARSYVTYPFLRRRWSRRPLRFQGRDLPYVRHHYNRAWRNERSVELTLARDFLSGTRAGRTLEIGNVLSHYWPVDHEVLDKYEASPGVLNEDIVDFHPEEPYDRVVSISTLEHVGWDERPREPDKVLRAYRNIRTLVRPGGSILLTCPIGQNPHLDEYLQAGEIDFPVQVVLRRTSADNLWEQTTLAEVAGARYGSPYRNANALFVGIVPGDDGWGELMAPAAGR
ncbi:MAG: glycosyltransferase [Acidimicrobiia bacterium]